MIKIYGMPTCPYCDYIHEQIKGRESARWYQAPILVTPYGRTRLGAEYRR